MKVFNILHISDAHIQKAYESEVREIVSALIDDVKKVQNEKGISIDLVCFTGDLIQRGDNAQQGENQLEIAKERMIVPLLEALNLSMENFVLVPGNHEVDTTKIVPALESGLQKTTLQEINEIIKSFHSSYNERLRYFYDYIETQYRDVTFGKLGYAYRKDINGLQIGIACVDSSWRSTGKGMAERGHIYVGVNQVKELFSYISDCNVKICMMHHPVNWLEMCEINEMEKALAKFDIVLCGHVHEENLKQVIKSEMKTVYCTAGKLYPLDYAFDRAVDGYNGYSILNVDYEEKKCNVYVRTYYAKNRNEFDVGINVCLNGEESFDICSRDDNWKLEYDMVRGIKNYFYNISEKYSLIKDIDTQSPDSFYDTLIEPVLSKTSGYVKENFDNQEKEVTNLQSIIESDNNIFFIGKKESGKTTILQQIALGYIDSYETKRILPVYIDMKHLPKGQDKIFTKAHHFIYENVLEETSVSKQDIKRMFEEGKVVFLIDNVKTDNADHTIMLTRFINGYNKNRFIFTIEEEFFQSLDVKEFPNYGGAFEEIYIHYMGKVQIRSMVTQWANGKENVNIDEVVNRIDSYCNQINFAKTPFNIAIFMVLWDSDNNFIPVNEGIVMENYLEIVLEKLSPKEGYRSTYSFKLKQHFLSHVAYQMYLKNEYYLSQKEFTQIVEEYHKKKGYNLNESRFDVIFFEKNILSYSGEVIVFSYTSFMEYFLAIYAINNKEFLKEITSKGKRILFANEICFYAGLNQNCNELLDDLSEVILNTVVEFFDLIEELNKLEIMAEFLPDRDTFIEKIKEDRPSQTKIDSLGDGARTYVDKNPTGIDKKKVVENEAEDFYSLLLMYGSVIKNAELLDNAEKITHLEYYMYGMNMLYALVIKLFEYGKEKVPYEKLNTDEKEKLNVHTEEEYEEMKISMLEFTKLMLPIAIQNMILENIGTPKLESAINNLIEKKSNKAFEKFMLSFLKSDLKIGGIKRELSRYVAEENSESILKLMLIKLTYYYRIRFFGNDMLMDKSLIDLITDIHMKLTPRLKSKHIPKSIIAKEIKKNLDE